MADLKIPSINNRSKQYLFKNKLSIRRKSKQRLIKESFQMLFFAVVLLFINYFITQKSNLFNAFASNIYAIFNNLLSIFGYLYEIALLLYVIITMLIVFILFIGIANRIFRIIRRKTNKIIFRQKI